MGKPLWDHEDEDIREKAIHEITDEKQLSKIALKSNKSDVVAYAMEQLESEDLVAKVLLNKKILFEATAFEALEKITNLKHLQKISKKVENDLIREKAAELAEEVEICKDILKLTDMIKISSLIKKIKREIILHKIAHEHKLYDVKKTVMAYIWEANDPSSNLWISHFLKPEYLSDIAFNDPEPMTRACAAENIHDQKILRKLIENDNDSLVVSAALKHFSDQNLLKDLAVNSPFPNIRNKALAKLDEKSLFEQVAVNDSFWRNRQLAYEKLGNEMMANREIVMNESHRDKLTEALKTLDDPELFTELAENNMDPFVREFALEQIKDSETKAKIKEQNLRKSKTPLFNEILSHAKNEEEPRNFRDCYLLSELGQIDSEDKAKSAFPQFLEEIKDDPSFHIPALWAVSCLIKMGSKKDALDLFRRLLPRIKKKTALSESLASDLFNSIEEDNLLSVKEKKIVLAGCIAAHIGGTSPEFAASLLISFFRHHNLNDSELISELKKDLNGLEMNTEGEARLGIYLENFPIDDDVQSILSHLKKGPKY